VCIRKYSNRFSEFIMTGEVAPTRPARRGGTARKEQRISIKLPKYRLELLFRPMRAFEIMINNTDIMLTIVCSTKVSKWL